MPGLGIDFVLPSDYDKLVVARQTELAHILEVLEKFTEYTDDPELLALIAWVEARRTCHQPGVT